MTAPAAPTLAGYGLALKWAAWDTAVLVGRTEASALTVWLGRFVLHSCDTPLCCNPKHLFIGTQADNKRDAISKERLPGAKLTAVDVLAIRRAPRGYGQGKALATAYGVSAKTISRVWRRQRWAHLP